MWEHQRLTRDWPPPDADALVARWQAQGCPPLEVGPGVTIHDLRQWLSATAVPQGLRDGELARVRELLGVEP